MKVKSRQHIQQVIKVLKTLPAYRFCTISDTVKDNLPAILVQHTGEKTGPTNMFDIPIVYEKLEYNLPVDGNTTESVTSSGCTLVLRENGTHGCQH